MTTRRPVLDLAPTLASRVLPARRSAGLSLFEVVVSVAILTVLTLSTLMVVVPVSKQTRSSRELVVANLEAMKVLEKIQSSPFESLTIVYPQGTEIPIAGLSGGKMALRYANATADPLFIEGTLTWQSEDLGDMALVFNTVRTR